LFGVAMGLYQHTMSLVPLSSILSSLLPQFTEKKDQFLRLINKGIKYQVLSYVGMSVLGVSIISFVVEYLFPNYRAAIPLYNVFLLRNT
jgi:O-antigen/teichoic acid export membrane protein